MYVSDSGCALSCDVGNLSENDKILVENLKMRIVGNEGFFYMNFRLTDGLGVDFVACK